VIAEIKRICADLLDDVRLRPTDLQSVGRKLDVIAFQPDRTLPYAGRLRRRADGRFVIQYAPSGGARFTVAHELGHAYLELSGHRPEDEERFCDRFAGELLMPSDLLANELKAPLTPVRLFDLTDAFGMSLHAAAVRCAELTPLGATSADLGGMLWRVGEIREFDSLLRSRAEHLLELKQPLCEVLNRENPDGPREWILEGERIPWRTTDALLLVRPR